MTASAAFAAGRFGLGARPGDLARIGRDPRGWAESQLRGSMGLPSALADRPSGDRFVTELLEARRNGAGQVEKVARERLRLVYVEEGAARTRAAIDSDRPLIERLVQFWSNHFTVSVQGKPLMLGLPGAYEREAIRPHVLGRFETMLRAVIEHPAMLIYLDNWVSVGPEAQLGRRSRRGLNENLAREILELHTLGVNGGYGQADVTAFARVLTGWTVGRPESDAPGRFRFVPAMHEPGDKTILGRRYAEAGKAEGDAVLRDLAAHPSTARFVAGKLARHFIADDPPAAAIERLAKRFRETGGDLMAVTSALLALPEAWPDRPTKVRSPNDLVIASFRALGGFQGEPPRLMQTLGVLEQAPFAASSPAGWPERAVDWIGPEALMKRIEWAHAVAMRWPHPPPALALAGDVLGDGLASGTRSALEHAPSTRDALALLLASPEFQRR